MATGDLEKTLNADIQSPVLKTTAQRRVSSPRLCEEAERWPSCKPPPSPSKHPNQPVPGASFASFL